MIDVHHPPMSTFTLSPEEQTAVSGALAKAKPWDEDNACVKGIKDKLKHLHLQRQGHTCCYCRNNLFGTGHFTIDREHILPKSIYKDFTFEVWNISIACKRCNMEVKGDKTEFFTGSLSDVQNPSFYAFVHPNFDVWENHLSRYAAQVDNRIVVHYSVKGESLKGSYTFKFFQLDRLEKNSLMVAQGSAPIPEDLSAALRSAIDLLAKAYGQT